MNKKLKDKLLKQCDNSLQRIQIRIALDPWYVKVLRYIRVVDWICYSIWYFKFKNRNNIIDGYNDIAAEIISDYEFGYTRTMIFEKIIYGAYGNDPMFEIIKKYEKGKKDDRASESSDTL